MLFVPGRLPCAPRARDEKGVWRTALLRANGRARNAPARWRGSDPYLAKRAWHWLLQYHQVLHGSLPGGHSYHRQCDYSSQRARGRSVLRSVDDDVPQNLPFQVASHLLSLRGQANRPAGQFGDQLSVGRNEIQLGQRFERSPGDLLELEIANLLGQRTGGKKDQLDGQVHLGVTISGAEDLVSDPRIDAELLSQFAC